MHELGTIYYVMKTVENLAAENKLTKVGSITLEVGEVSGIVPEFLTDFWEYARKKNDLFRDTELKIETLHAITYCQDCRQTYDTVPQGKICPHCGSGPDLRHRPPGEDLSPLRQREHLSCDRQRIQHQRDRSLLRAWKSPAVSGGG